MQFKSSIKTGGNLWTIFSISTLSPMLVAYVLHDGAPGFFFETYLVTFLIGFFCWQSLIKHRREMSTRDGFPVIALFNFSPGSFGASPFVPETGSNAIVPEAKSIFKSGRLLPGNRIIRK
jgi:trk system potassium uptake protein TrkH